MPILKIKDSNNNWVGVPVAKGDTGENAYIWIKYSATQPTADSDMTDTPSPWIGLYSGTSDSAPSHYTDYTWYKFKGEQGEQGEPGETGATPDFSIGTVTTGAAGSSASASITGTAEHPVLNLTIPRGNTGEVSEAQLLALLPTDTASGAVASFPDGADDVPMESLSVALEPIQDLHGYANPWPAGGGKNLWAEYETQTINDVTLTNDHGKVTINGTASADTYFDINVNYNVAENEYIRVYAFNPVASTSNRLTLFVITSAGNPQVNMNNVNASYSDTVAQARTITKLRLRVPNGVQYSSFVLYPYVQIGGVDPTAWTPCSNLCPISGRSSVTAVRDGKNLIDDSKRYVSGSTTVYIGAESDAYTVALPAGTYTISVDFSGETYGMYYREANDAENTSLWNSGLSTTEKTFTIEEGIYRFWVYRNTNAGGVDPTKIIHVQIELGSPATAYAPYNGNTYTTQLGQTVYGCTVDLVSGVLTVDMGIVNLASLDYTIATSSGVTVFRNNIGAKSVSDNMQHGLTSIYPFAGTRFISNMPNKTWMIDAQGRFYIRDDTYTTKEDIQLAMTGQQLCYELATPLVIQLTATEITTLLGENTVFSDSGDVAVTYKADIQKYIDKKIAEL